MLSFLSGPLSVETLTVKLPRLPRHWQGIKLVQLSDFHYDGLRLSEAMLEQAIAACNAAQPDLIMLTGDFITCDPQPIHALVQRLKRLESRKGIYAVLGNHDSYAPDLIRQALTRGGIQVLWNQVAYPLGDELAIAGMADLWSGDFHPEAALDGLDPEIPRLVLSHNPDSADALRRWRVDLQLSGHTHGGQIQIPGLGTPARYYYALRESIPKSIRCRIPGIRSRHLSVIHHWEWMQGLHRVGEGWLYVNRGLGTYPPGRFRCPPEVTVMTLVGEG